MDAAVSGPNILKPSDIYIWNVKNLKQYLS